MDIADQGEELSEQFVQHLRKDVMQVRVHENFEPPHFLQIFKGRLIVFKGKSVDFDPKGSGCIYPNTYLLKVIGNATHNSKAIQISSKISEFTSNDCFIIRTADGNNWIWCGPSSTGDNREVAKSIGALIGEYSLVIGGNESTEFWQYIPQTLQAKLKNANANRNNILLESDVVNTIEENFFIDRSKVELFVCSIDANGVVTNKQVIGYTQNDLSPEDIYLLDARLFIYIWIGSLWYANSNSTKNCESVSTKYLLTIYSNFSLRNEKSNCWRIIGEYLKHYPTAREPLTPQAVVYQGLEPSTFTGFFDDHWNPILWEVSYRWRIRIKSLDLDHSQNTFCIMFLGAHHIRYGTFEH